MPRKPQPKIEEEDHTEDEIFEESEDEQQPEIVVESTEIEAEEPPEEAEEETPVIEEVPVKKTTKKKPTSPTTEAPKKSPTPKSRTKKSQKQKPPTTKKAKPQEYKISRKNITSEILVNELDAAKNLLTQEIQSIKELQGSQRRGIRSLQQVRKRIAFVGECIPHMVKTKRRLRNNGSSGFNKPKYPSNELKTFLGLKNGDMVSRAEATRALCTYIKLRPDETREEFKQWAHLNPGGKRNLQDPEVSKRILPDDKLSKLLSYEQYKKDVKAGKFESNIKQDNGTYKKEILKDDHLYYNVLQRLLNPHLLAEN
jgi:chromatin remodeling complex protein RSC6